MIDYDAATCITAGELREMGCEIPAKVPDCAWVPRHAMIMGDVSARLDPLRDTLDCTVLLSFAQPFRWVVTRSSLFAAGR